mmetsp:Transcript_30445/g.46882  ORF Transcript_30445/g.46882 Transcript_30445/m.46882 type:complete len:96 (+) Transcript_30445:67-354(+)
MRASTCAMLVLAALAPSAQAAVQAGSLRGESALRAGVAAKASACSEDEYKRYTTIVCKVEEACGCADTTCELEWCSSYVHEWKKTFGACILKGCP